ncbi:MAG: capsule biosynthesis protein [Candidatus Rokuibacteriota bacterium]
MTAFLPRQRDVFPRPQTDHILPDWAAILDTNRPLWEKAKRRAAKGPKVLVATSVGGFSALSVVESVVAVALSLRGAQVHTLLCDKVLPACLRVEKPQVPDPETLARYELPRILCDLCSATGRYVFGPLGLNDHVFGELLAAEDRDRARRLAQEVPYRDIEHYRQEGWAIGEHAYAGALRYFATGNLEDEPHGEVVVRRYFEGALLTAAVIRRLLTAHGFTVACFNHGIYSPPGVIGEACRASGVRVANWNVAYRKRCFIFSHGDTYHHTLLDEPVDAWEGMPWDDAMEQAVVDYLKSRWVGTRDWIWFHEKPDEDFERFVRESGLDPGKPIIGMLTNVTWDAQLHYRANAFPNMLAWVLQTIDYFAKRPELQLLIRVHPAEIRGTLPSRQPILAEIKKAYPALPPNVFAIPPDSPVSTYAAMFRCNAVIIYGTKTGVELTSMGVPVIVAGEAWIRNKGLTVDASSPEDYVRILDRLPLPRHEDPERLTRARKYAYHFFFRRMVPLGFMEPTGAWPPYRVSVSRLDDLLPGADPGLDVICDGVLAGTPFVYQAEKHGVHEG